MTDDQTLRAAAEPMRRILTIVATLLLSVGVIGSTTTITGTIMAHGIVITSKSAEAVSHRTGGIVSAIHVEDGQTVTKGDLLFTLDTAPQEKALSRIESRRVALRLKAERLESLAANAQEMRVTADLAAALETLGLNALVAAEQKLFEAERRSRSIRKARLRQDQARWRARLLELKEEIDAKEREIGIVTRAIEEIEKDGTKNTQMKIRDLLANDRLKEQRLLGLERDRARLMGELQRLKAARNEAAIQHEDRDRQLQDIESDDHRRALSELSDIAANLQILGEEAQSLTSEIEANRVTAPASGIVRDIAVRTSGQRIEPNAIALRIVGPGDNLMIAAEIAPRDAGALAKGQRALVRLLSAAASLPARVEDIRTDTRPSMNLAPSQIIAHLAFEEGPDDRRITAFSVPGMTVDIVIETETRTALSYLLRPLTEALSQPLPR